MIKRLVANGTTILLTTQYMDEADHLADRIVVIDNGKVIAQGTADSLKARVGADRLELIIAKSSDFAKAKKAIAGEVLHEDAQRKTLIIAIKRGVSELKIVLQRLEDASIQVESVSLHRPTLDDVFLKLTGHAASRENDEDHAGKEKNNEKK